MVQKQGTIDFLGWSMVAKLSPAPFLEKQLSALKIRLYMVQRLAAKGAARHPGAGGHGNVPWQGVVQRRALVPGQTNKH